MPTGFIGLDIHLCHVQFFRRLSLWRLLPAATLTANEIRCFFYIVFLSPLLVVTRGFTGLRLSEFAQISEFFQF